MADPQSYFNSPIDLNVNETGPQESAFDTLVKQGSPDEVSKATNMRWIINLFREWVRRPQVVTASQAHTVIYVSLDEDKVILDNEWEMLLAIDDEDARERYLRCRLSKSLAAGNVSGGPFDLACADSRQLEALLEECSSNLPRSFEEDYVDYFSAFVFKERVLGRFKLWARTAFKEVCPKVPASIEEIADAFYRVKEQPLASRIIVYRKLMAVTQPSNRNEFSHMLVSDEADRLSLNRVFRNHPRLEALKGRWTALGLSSTCSCMRNASSLTFT
ncbi:hypothetical protein DIURU_004182 [Diutina rugosa]|uniref:Uncharacterized protein n=1 Tax=Diutina rugosa TaxID=5481 RepID=A0A642UQ89_DIURU|nr:uncharacterized protein DIURU_004182 [Diutina rugosa]KAA8899699.1 hypothetical protein DIURU_004182 [Diutina rugosa]